MCIVSMVGEAFGDTFGRRWPMIPQEPWVAPTINQCPFKIDPFVTQAQFDELKKEIEEIRELLKRALAFDQKTGQPHCEKPDKLALILALAEALGVDMSSLNLNKSGGTKT